jgi:hypothetical protein
METLPSIRFLRSVSSGLPYGRQAKRKTRLRGVFNARIGGMSQARTKLRTTASAHSEGRVSQTRALHARPWHSRQGAQARWPRITKGTLPLGAALFVLARSQPRQATKAPGPTCRYGQATGSLPAKRHGAKPLSAQRHDMEDFAWRARLSARRQTFESEGGASQQKF